MVRAELAHMDPNMHTPTNDGQRAERHRQWDGTASGTTHVRLLVTVRQIEHVDCLEGAAYQDVIQRA